jgi:hypothetical protein
LWCSGDRVKKELFVTMQMCLKVSQVLLWDVYDLYSPGSPEKELFLQMKIAKNAY